MKFCTVIAYYITSITKELKFLNSHRSIVCIYCSFVCLITKSQLKINQIFKFFKLNKVHIGDSLFNEDSKNINFSPGMALILGGGKKGNFNSPY